VAEASIRHHLGATRQRLRDAGTEDADIESELLLREALRGPGASLPSRSYLYQRLDDPLSPAATARLASIIERRMQREPVAYITGEREFRGLTFEVSTAVLIPRPETELLVDRALALLRQRCATGRRAIVVDIGTGSGAIAVSLAVEEPRASVYATDVSHEALGVASRNVERHGMVRQLRLAHGYLMEPLDSYVDLIVANLPYVTTEDWRSLPPELREHEPRLALDGGEDGLDLIRALLHQAPRYLRPGGAVCLEFGIEQRDAIVAAVEAAFPGAGVEMVEDFAGIPRVLVARSR
jgi:release factor glutamine methyltransferase